MVKAMRSREVLTEEDEVTEALKEAGMSDLDGLSFHEKKQILQAVQDSKQSQPTAETSRNAQDVSSTTLEKGNDNNIVVQIEDSGDEDFFADLTTNKEEVQSSVPLTDNIQPFDSYNDTEDAVGGSKQSSSQHVDLEDASSEHLFLRRPTAKEWEKHNLLMDLNVIVDHKLERNKANVPKEEFYEERLSKLRADKKNKCHRLPWYFDKGLNISQEEHYSLVLKDLDQIAAAAASRRLKKMKRKLVVHVNQEEEEIEPLLPYGLKPADVLYRNVTAIGEIRSPSKHSDSDESLFSPKRHRESTPKKIVIKPRVVDLEENIFDENAPGPSNLPGGFIRNSQQNDKEETVIDSNDEDEQIIENSQEEMIACPLCCEKFEKSKIEAHCAVCEPVAKDSCPLCNVALPAESLREKHLAKCRTRQTNRIQGDSYLWKENKEKNVDTKVSSESGDSDVEEEPPSKKICS